MRYLCHLHKLTQLVPPASVHTVSFISFTDLLRTLGRAQILLINATQPELARMLGGPGVWWLIEFSA